MCKSYYFPIFRNFQRIQKVLHELRKSDKIKIIIVASDCLPLTDQDSGSLRMSLILEGIQKTGYRIVFCSHRNLSNMPGTLARKTIRRKYEKFIRDRGVDKVIYGIDELQKYLEKNLEQVKLVFAAFPHVAADVLTLLRAGARKVPFFYDMVDAHAVRMKREAAIHKSKEKFAEALIMEKLETHIFSLSDSIFAVSNVEKNYVLSIRKDANVHVLGNGFSIRKKAAPGPSGRKDVLFIGGFWHSPNLDAVNWFVAEVWPLIYAANSNTQFLIGGSNIEDRLNHIQKVPGVKVLGHIKDLDSFFDGGRIMVAPLRYGAGVKGKVGQSMAYGLPVVGTSTAAEGMDISHGREILIADTAPEMASEIIKILNDDIKWSNMQKLAQLYIGGQSPELIDIVISAAISSTDYISDKSSK